MPPSIFWEISVTSYTSLTYNGSLRDAHFALHFTAISERALTACQTRPSHTRLGGLDGLRAITVISALIYHLFPPLLPGGYLGVDVFFAISGFLITTLLFREWHETGRINLIGFWKRRIRRLIPALILVTAMTMSLGFLVGGDILYRIKEQTFGALFFVSNRVFIVAGSDYFAQDVTEVLRNTWSLAIEEQFYLVLPLLLTLLLKTRSRVFSISVFTALASVSAWLMFTMSRAGVDLTRVYFGSDSHVFGMLLGVALALASFRHRLASPLLSPFCCAQPSIDNDHPRWSRA